MTVTRSSVLRKLPTASSSAAYRQLRALAAAKDVQVTAAPSVQSANEVLSIWQLRLWNSVVKGHRITGLADLVRKLMTLAEDAPVQQIVLLSDKTTGLLFLDDVDAPLGAVVTTRTQADVARSQRNLARANGAPQFLRGRS